MFRLSRLRIPQTTTSGHHRVQIKWLYQATYQENITRMQTVRGCYHRACSKRFYTAQHNTTHEEAMPKELKREILSTRPQPMREELVSNSKVTREELEKCDIAPYKRSQIHGRYLCAQTAAVPGMVGAAVRHMRSFRSMKSDGGWIVHLLHEAEDERIHLMIFLKTLRPGFFNRLVMLTAQGIFLGAYTVIYLVSPKTAHRFCGYLEEEAIGSYTHFLQDLEKGVVEDRPAPHLAIGKLRVDELLLEAVLYL